MTTVSSQSTSTHGPFHILFYMNFNLYCCRNVLLCCGIISQIHKLYLFYSVFHLNPFYLRMSAGLLKTLEQNVIGAAYLQYFTWSFISISDMYYCPCMDRAECVSPSHPMVVTSELGSKVKQSRCLILHKCVSTPESYKSPNSPTTMTLLFMLT